CLLDVDRGGAWLCRDRLGIKPLYYTRTPQGGFLFASELRALLQAGPELLRPASTPQRWRAISPRERSAAWIASCPECGSSDLDNRSGSIGTAHRPRPKPTGTPPSPGPTTLPRRQRPARSASPTCSAKASACA